MKVEPHQSDHQRTITLCWYFKKSSVGSTALNQRIVSTNTFFYVSCFFFRKAVKRSHLQGAFFGLAEAFQYCASAAAFRYGGYLVVNGEMTMDEVIK